MYTGYLDAEVFALQFVGRKNLAMCYVLVPALCDGALSVGVEIARAHRPQTLQCRWISNSYNDSTLLLN